MKQISRQTIRQAIIAFSALFTYLSAPLSKVFAQGVDDSFDKVTGQMLDDVNPLQFSTKADTLSKPAGIINELLVYVFPLAGLLLFVMILWGGFEVIYQAAGKKSLDAGKQRITSALIGFVLLFVSYWLVRIVEEVFGVNIITIR